MTGAIENSIYVEEDTQKDKLLIFFLDKEVYGLEISYVTEIVGIQNISEMPDLPLYIKGIINLRGNIIPVMDVRLRFRKEPKMYNDRTCVIVIDVNDMSIGLIVDGVSEVITIKDKDIVKPPKINKTYKNSFIKNIFKNDKDINLIIDCEKLLSEDEYEDLGNKF